MERVILVDEKDNEIGTEEKLKAHELGKLHRAFSVFVFNSEGKLLLQKRALTKYHSAGLLTNTCCSHPRIGESLDQSVHRRLKEEMGFDCDLKEICSFIYKGKLDHDLCEHEIDHVFVGNFNGIPVPNPEEVDSWEWADIRVLKEDVKQCPEKYTYWFPLALAKIL